MAQWNSARTKVQLRLAVQRLRMVQQKQEALAKKARRDIATLVEKGKIETARVRVENIINEDIHNELLELLELYCELLVARFGLLDMNTREPDPGVKEGVHLELHVLREMLMSKYGREFAIGVMDNKDNCVSERVTRKLQVTTPSPVLVDAYLGEIAKGYGIDWSPPPPPNNTVENPSSPKPESIALQADEPEAKAILSPAKFKDSEAKLPDVPAAGGSSEPPPSYPAAAASSGGGKSNEEDLFKRLENLKRR
ncbi:unnamed protein product [Rhizoctonia solani]|uniref:IST1 homolog n=1 Tax=Rhizoctonia solani TaxID=456999 RepID=A0A8H3C841_9AGAM|nr:unnamed protein product [Rhizoctonia solani]